MIYEYVWLRQHPFRTLHPSGRDTRASFVLHHTHKSAGRRDRMAVVCADSTNTMMANTIPTHQTKHTFGGSPERARRNTCNWYACINMQTQSEIRVRDVCVCLRVRSCEMKWTCIGVHTHTQVRARTKRVTFTSNLKNAWRHCIRWLCGGECDCVWVRKSGFSFRRQA